MAATIANPPARRTTEQTAALLLEFYREECARWGLPPEVPSVEALAATGVAAVAVASGLPLGTDATERAALTALAQTPPF